MNKDIVINCENVTKTYKLFDSPTDRVKEAFHPFRKKYHRPFNALDKISFKVRKGESLGIIGRNGSGKSTLLQIVSGILTPSSGSVEVQGRVSALLELGTGFNLEFSGRQNVYLSASILGLNKEETDIKFDEIAAFADIGDFLDQPVKVYSSGMMMRLAFAVQSAVDPGIMIVDEVLAVGDMRFAMKCLRRMHELMEKGTAFLFVSHDMSSVVNFCNKVIWLHDGKIMQKGIPKQITMDYSNFMTYGFMPPEEEWNAEGNDISVKNSAVTGIETQVAGLACLEVYKDRLPWVEVAHLPSTGIGGAMIERVALLNISNPHSSTLLEGGELVEIFLNITTKVHLKSPNVCADFRDRKGNLIFGLNPQLLAQSIPELIPNGRVIIHFRFRFPLVLNGEYSISFALADGSLSAHTQHHIIPDALLIKVSSHDPQRNHYIISLDDIGLSVMPPTFIDFSNS
jgi:ABC-type polysaccharide/polyol phosphate transport system ATPase subunit